MRCPFCHHTLVNKGREENFESLVEHVFSPNSEGKDRPVWECDNPECLTVKLGMDCFWSSEGEFFGDSKEIVMRRNLGYNKSYSALDSSWEKVDRECGKISIKLSDADPKETLIEELKKQYRELEERVNKNNV